MIGSFQLRKLVLCLTLQMAAVLGAPIRPEEIEDLLRLGQQARIERRIREHSGDPPAPPE